MNKTITIDKNIPIPEDSSTRKYDFRNLKSGDSFLLDTAKHRYAIYSALRWYNKKNKAKVKIITRKEGETVRVWIK